MIGLFNLGPEHGRILPWPRSSIRTYIVYFILQRFSFSIIVFFYFVTDTEMNTNYEYTNHKCVTTFKSATQERNWDICLADGRLVWQRSLKPSVIEDLSTKRRCQMYYDS